MAASLVQAGTNAPAKPLEQAGVPTPVIQVNRRPSADEQAPVLPQFSKEPTSAELFEVQAFEQPLVPVGTPTVDDNKALARMLSEYIKCTGTNGHAMVLAFLKQNPKSAWRAALLLNLGISWREQGRFSKAIDAWTEAWESSKKVADIRGKAMADEVLGQLLQIYVWAGAYEKLEPLLAEVENRQLMGGVTEVVASARRAIWNSQHRPDEGSKCGPYALQQLLSVKQPGGDVSKIFEARATRHGFSLTDLKQLAIESGMKYQMARGTNKSDVPVNSVVHWKFNHYGALLNTNGDRYLVQDSAYKRIYGQELWISKATLFEESDGYFLIPAGAMPAGWQIVGAEEGQKVLGSGPTQGPDQNAFGENDDKPCPNNNDGNENMARASAHLMLVSLNIVDTPLYYRPPVGPKVKFKITYNQKDIYSQVAPNYSNLGPKWTFDWATYITDVAPAQFGVGSNVNLYVSGGSRTSYTPSGTPLEFIPDRDGGVLRLVGCEGVTNNINSCPAVYELTYPDGSKKIYGNRNGPLSLVVSINSHPRKFRLQAIVDPSGNALTMNYDSYGRLGYVNDAIGQTTTLHYDLASDPYKITSVTDPFGRLAYFTYDEHGRLHQSIDMIGITSAFNYNSGDFINQMTTPYGVSKFSYNETANGSYLDRSLLLTSPNGDREYLIYSENWPFPSTGPVSGTLGGEPVPSDASIATATGGYGLLNFRNTYYFNKKAMSQYAANVLPPPSDYANATVYHWLHDNDYTGTTLTSGMLESVKPPLESRIWYEYPGQNQPAASAGISNRSPSLITRVVADPATSGAYLTQTYHYTYNGQGRITQVIDPAGRQTTNEYYLDGIDLYRVSQINGTGSDILAEYGNYYNHRPFVYIDAARQTYYLFWNSFGQLTQVSNPKGEVIQLAYDNNKFLQTVTKSGSGLAASKSFTYDAYNRVHTVTYLANYTASSENYTLTYDYDKLNRVTKITYPDSTTEKFVYNRLDLAIAYDRAGSRTVYSYDALGRPLSVKDRLNQITRFSWCGCGSLESITDPLGQVTTWSRDLEGRVMQKIFNDSKSTTFTYDSYSGRLASATDANGQTKNYFYNPDNTLTNITYTGAIIDTPSVSFTYDSVYRRLLSMADGTGQTTYTYNPVTGSTFLGAGRLASESGEFTGYTITNIYDELGRQTSRAINGTSESVAFDALGRVTSHVTALGTFTPVYSFGSVASFRPGKLNYPNNQASVYSFDNAQGDEHLLEIKNLNPSGTVLSKFDYQYDVLSRITQWTQQADNGTPTVHNYEYDYEGQLLNDVIAPQGQSANKAYTYAYDAGGNRTSEEVDVTGSSPVSTVTTSSYNGVNQLTSRTGSGTLPVRFKGTINEPATATVNGQAAKITVNPANPSGRVFTSPASLSAGSQTVPVTATDLSANTASHTYSLTVAGGSGKTFLYDNNGNCTNMSTAGTNTVYQWDAENRLVAINAYVTNTATTFRSEFTYDGYGRRVQAVEKNNGTVTSTKRFVWAGMDLVQERDGNNAVTKRFFAGGEQIAGVNYFFTRDHLGSVREMTDSSGTVRSRYDYDSYGRRTKLSGDLDADFGFAGQYVHAPSGLYLTLFRAYDSDTGRWLNHDPIQERGGINLYSYVKNNPLNYIDRFGLAPTSSAEGDFNTSYYGKENNYGNGIPVNFPKIQVPEGIGENIPGSADAFQDQVIEIEKAFFNGLGKVFGVFPDDARFGDVCPNFDPRQFVPHGDTDLPPSISTPPIIYSPLTAGNINAPPASLSNQLPPVEDPFPLTFTK